MKYFIYFHFYLLSTWNTSEFRPLATNMAIWQDSISFYAYDYKYVKWKIDEITYENFNENLNPITYNNAKTKIQLNALYFISYYDLKGTVYIKSPYTEIRIFTEGKPIIIYLKE